MGKEIIMPNGRNVFIDVYNAFAASPYGAELGSRIRYERYKPDSVSKERWVQILGPDVNNLEHHVVSVAHGKRFLFCCSKEGNGNESAFFFPEEEDLILLTLALHDFGEAVKGDKSFDQKTSKDEHEELGHLRRIFKELCDQTCENYFTEKQLLETVNVITGVNPKLGKAFNAIERIGYMTTGVHAWSVSHFLMKAEAGLGLSLQWLAHNVLINQTRKLLEYREIYPPVNAFLLANACHITEAFEGIPNEVYSLYDQTDVHEKHMKFNEVKQAWMNCGL